MTKLTLEEITAKSLCYGTAWDKSAEECKVCDVKNKCQAETVNGGYASKPSPPVEFNNKDNKVVNIGSARSKVEPAEKPAKPAKSTESSEKPVKEKAPKAPKAPDDFDYGYDFKAMSIEELLKVAKKEGLDPKELEEKYGKNPSIYKMRVQMAIKSAIKEKAGK